MSIVGFLTSLTGTFFINDVSSATASSCDMLSSLVTLTPHPAMDKAITQEKRVFVNFVINYLFLLETEATANRMMDDIPLDYLDMIPE